MAPELLSGRGQGRHQVKSSRPRLASSKLTLSRLARSRLTVIVAALLATVTIGAVGCLSQMGAALAPSHLSRIVDGVPLARSAPVRLQIGAIGVDSALMHLGLRADGSMAVPPRAFPAGWYDGGPTPGELGPAIIAGHIDMKGPGVFYKLHDVKPGDQITVTRADGSKPVFRVTRVTQFPKDRFPTTQVYGNIDHAGLRLITCGGSYNSRTGHYEDNLVAFADLVAPAR
jgi:Sortase domain